MALTHVRIVGSGLIGTSIGLALRANGISVTMVDIDQEAAALAQDLIGESGPESQPEITVIASPISTISAVIQAEVQQGINLGFIDISSVKVNPVVEVKATGFDMSKFLPTKPTETPLMNLALLIRDDGKS